jgi:hypothetical protein
MHTIEPYYNWRHLYTVEDDERSPFYGRTYDEFNFTQTIYNYYIHPQWDDFGSRTLYLKIIFADYDHHFAVIELIGEWNDAIENDIMTLKGEVIDKLIDEGISRFILSGENVLNFHSSDSSYYEEWAEDIASSAGWVVVLNMPEQSQYDFRRSRITDYLHLLDFPVWRTVQPQHLFTAIDNLMLRRLNNG